MIFVSKLLAKRRHDREYRALQRRYNELQAEEERLQKEREELRDKGLHTKLTLIGSLVYLWARLEVRLGLIVQVIHNLSGDYALAKPLPRELDRKLDYISTKMYGVPELAHCIPLMKKVVGKCHSNKQLRHNLVHGDYVLENEPYSPTVFNIQLSVVKGHTVKYHPTKYTSEQLNKHSKRAASLFQDGEVLFQQVAAVVVQLSKSDS